MPELPEVETVVRTLRPHLLGRRIVGVRHLRADIVRPDGIDVPARMAGRVVGGIARRGKRILLCLDSGQRLCIHLGMTGRLTVGDADALVRPHTHMVADLDTGRQLRFVDPRRFGGIMWVGDGDCGDEGLGPEPLRIRPAALARRLSATRRAIKSALLDQSLLAGLGNIYVDESLFRAGIHPLTPANTLGNEQSRRLCRAIKFILRRAIRDRGSTLRDYVDVNGESGRFQNLHAVYGREAQPCPRCRRPIHRIVLGGRSTHFCTHCQPPTG